MRTKGQLAARMILVFLASALTVRCTTTTGALKLHRPKAQVAVTVADIKLAEGTECLVRLISGEDVRERVIVAAIAGGLIGYHSGESRADIVFEHGGKPPLQSRQKNNGAGREPAP